MRQRPHFRAYLQHAPYRLVLEIEQRRHRLDIIGIFVVPASSGISDPVSLTRATKGHVRLSHTAAHRPPTQPQAEKRRRRSRGHAQTTQEVPGWALGTKILAEII